MPEPQPLRRFIGDVAFGFVFRLVVLGVASWLLSRLWPTPNSTATFGWVLGLSLVPALVEVWRYVRSRSPDR